MSLESLLTNKGGCVIHKIDQLCSSFKSGKQMAGSSGAHGEVRAGKITLRTPVQRGSKIQRG